MAPDGDTIPVGLVRHRGGLISYANLRFCEIVGRPREAVVGHTFDEILSPDEHRRIMDRYAQRLRGESVPSEYEVRVKRASDGAWRVVEVAVQILGDEVIVVVRDVTETAGRRDRRMGLALLGADLAQARSEAAVKSALRERVGRLGLWGAWLVPDGDDRMRVEFADMPDRGVAFESTIGRAVAGWMGPWLPWFRRAWIEGASYHDDAITEVARFVGAPWEAAVRGLAEKSELRRGVALRVDQDGEPIALLVLRGGWLSEDDLPMVRLLAAQLSSALDNARFIDEARRQMVALEALHGLATTALQQAAHAPTELLLRAASVARDALRGDDARVFMLRDDARSLQELVVGGGTDSPAFPIDEAPLVQDALEASGWSVCDDLRVDPRGFHRGSLAESVGAALVMAFDSSQGTRGVLLVHAPAGRRFSDEDLALMRALMGVLQVGLSNSELYAQAKARLDELHAAQTRLLERERLAALGEVAAVIAHEVRNPLAVVFNAVSALRRLVPRDGTAAELIETVREEAERLNQIVGDLLGFARPVAPTPQPEALAPLVEGALSVASARAATSSGAARVHVTLDVPTDLPDVRVDARLLRQAMVNVLLNAYEAMPGGGELAVRAFLDVTCGRVVVAVRDTGVGMDDDVRARMFEPFFTTRPTGTGLGLALVHRIVEAHGGQVRVTSSPGVGTEVRFDLPVGEV